MGVCAGRVRNIDQTMKMDDKMLQDDVQQQMQQQTDEQQNSNKINANEKINNMNDNSGDNNVKNSQNLKTDTVNAQTEINTQSPVQNQFKNSLNLDVQALKVDNQQEIQKDNEQIQQQDQILTQNINPSISFSVKDNSIHSNRQSIVQLQGIEEEVQPTTETQQNEKEVNIPIQDPNQLLNSQPFQTVNGEQEQLITAVFMPVTDKEDGVQANQNKLEQVAEEDSREYDSVQFIPQNQLTNQNNSDNPVQKQDNEQNSDSETPPVSINIGPITATTENKKQQQILEQQQLDIDINQDYQEAPKQKRYKRKKARAVIQRELEAQPDTLDDNQQNVSIRSEDLEINIDASVKDTIKETRTIELAKRMETKKQEQLDNLLSGNVLGLPQANGQESQADAEKDNILGEILGADNFNL